MFNMGYLNDVIMLHMQYGLMVNFFYELFRFLKSFLYLCTEFIEWQTKRYNISSIIKWAER